MVTAKHVAEKLHPPFVIRINKKGGGAGLIHIERPTDIKWCFHPTDMTVDIAVTAIDLPGWTDASSYSTDGVLVTDPPDIAQLGAGDLAFVVGLFHLHRGELSNLPIVHSGNIALMPGDERIPVDDMQIEGYLVQANAISGCSGSPVFATRSVIWTVNKGKEAEKKIAGHTAMATLIGVWSSSWKVSKSEIVAVRTNDDDQKGTLAPLGMGIVIPASKLADILLGKELMAEHKKRLIRS